MFLRCVFRRPPDNFFNDGGIILASILKEFRHLFADAGNLENATPPMRKQNFSGSECKDFHVFTIFFQDKFQHRLLIDIFSILGGLETKFWKKK